MKMSTSITTTTTTMTEDQTHRYQQLKQRKEALEKKLNEKYEQLHQICQKVSHANLQFPIQFQEFHSSFI